MKEHKYGMKQRGFSPGCQPMNGLLYSSLDLTYKYYAILTYDRELSDVEMDLYDLEKVEEE